MPARCTRTASKGQEGGGWGHLSPYPNRPTQRNPGAFIPNPLFSPIIEKPAGELLGGWGFLFWLFIFSGLEHHTTESIYEEGTKGDFKFLRKDKAMITITTTAHSIEGTLYGNGGAKLVLSVHPNGVFSLYATGKGVGEKDENFANLPNKYVGEAVEKWEIEGAVWLVASVPSLLRFFGEVIEKTEVMNILGEDAYQSLRGAIDNNGYFPC